MGTQLTTARRAALAVVAAAIALLAFSPAPAEAGCGGVREYKPTRNTTPGAAPLAVGDSVMLLALPYLAREGYLANARGCRGFQEGLSLLRQRRLQKRLPKMVVMALGADFSISLAEIRRAMRIVTPTRLLVLVTPWELGGHAGSDAQVVREAGRRWPRHVKVLDWVKYSRGHGSWFQPDGVHLTFTGARAFARLLGQALPWAAGPQAG
jgi:hypothetical protein